MADDAFACRVIIHILIPRFLSWMASHDTASIIRQALGRGGTRSKTRAMKYLRQAADNAAPPKDACLRLAIHMYADRPHAREAGRVGQAAGVATSAGVVEGHDAPPGCFDQRDTLVAEGVRERGT